MDDTGCQPSPGHLNQSVAITQSPGHQKDIGLNGPNLIIFSNLTRQALAGFPAHFYLISHLLSKMIVIGIIIIVKSNHLDMIVFHLR